MGFTLAQASVYFVMPSHAVNIYTQPIALFAFLLTFAIVASTWYSHHWLFDYLFVPTNSTIIVNFATLASLVWLVYQLQVFLHFGPTNEGQFAAISYLLTFGVAWLLLGLLYGDCLRLRWKVLPDGERREASFKTGRIALVGLTTLVATLIMWLLHKPVITAFWVILVAAMLYRVAARFAGLRG